MQQYACNGTRQRAEHPISIIRLLCYNLVSINDAKNCGEDNPLEQIDMLVEGAVFALLQVLPGSRIPADGIVHKGTSYVDESMITGESKLISKHIGDEVIGGSMNSIGSIVIQVLQVVNGV